MNIFAIVYFALSFSILLTVLAFVLLNQAVFRRPERRYVDRASTGTPFVSVLVPARNEEAKIRNCLESLMAQDYPEYEIILLDDRSDDGTRSIAESLGFSTSGRFRIVEGKPLPEGWAGKCWACKQLAGEAAGEMLLFTDADTVHDRDCLSMTTGYALERNAGMLSLWPRQETVTLAEKLVIPLVYLLILGFLPQFLLSVLQKFPSFAALLPRKWLHALGAANGQFVLFQKDCYERIGGHEAVRDHLVEDVALGRLVASYTGEGIRLVNADGYGLIKCRMYQSAREVWEGFTKNLRPAFDENSAAFFLSLIVQFTAFVLPFLLLLLPGTWTALLLIQVAVVYGIRLVLQLKFHTSPLGTILHPLGHIFALAIALNSWRRWRSGGVAWKGRSYVQSGR